jgi:hypothetical protein
MTDQTPIPPAPESRPADPPAAVPVPPPAQPARKKSRFWWRVLIVSQIVLVVVILGRLLIVPLLAAFYDRFDFADHPIEWATKQLPVDMAGEELLRQKSELIRVLGEKGTAAMPYLRRALQSDMPNLVNAGAMGVYTLGTAGAEALPELIRAAEHPHPFARLGAILAIGRIGPKAHPALPVLCNTLRDPHAHLRMVAAEAIKAIGDPAALPFLQEALDRENRSLCVEFIQLAILDLRGVPRRPLPNEEYLMPIVPAQ